MIRGELLPGWARAAITRAVGAPVEAFVPPVDDPSLDEPGAVFVTLTQGGRLRGCIGSLAAHRSVREDVLANAIAAAIRDPRFPPLTAGELPATEIEVSLLSAPEPTGWRTFDDALAGVRPGIDGLVLSSPGRGARGTFLPAVWEELPEPREFLGHLIRKAGLSAWPDDAVVERYTATKFTEGDPR